MDVITISFYAAVCGVLGWAGPMLGRPLVRLVIGAVVGVVAASILPTLRGMIF